MALVEQTALEDATAPYAAWKRKIYSDLKERLEVPSLFPCVFSQNTFRRKLLLFSFVEIFEGDDPAQSASDLAAYVDDARRWDGHVNSARPLIVAFGHSAATFKTLEEYHQFGWRVLQYWHNVDPIVWPPEVAKEPHQPFWSMCFNGMQLFVNMSAPRHEVRKSRNLGEHFIFVVNPRERFDIVAGDTSEGRKVRSNIRQRVHDYDGQRHSLQLGSYQAGEIEWWQYGIIEQNRERTDICPFRFSHTTRST